MTDTVTESVDLLVELKPLEVLADERKFKDFYSRMKEETSKVEVDLTTERGRKAIASMAYKVSRTKTAIDDAGKLLCEEARKKITAIDASRKQIRDALDALRDEVRKPLTEWEARRDEQQLDYDQIMRQFTQATIVTISDTSAILRARWNTIREIGLSDDDFDTLDVDMDKARQARDNVLLAIEAAIENVEKQEKELAELEQLRRERAEREANERAEREATERQRIEDERRAREETERKEREEAEQRRLREAEEQAVERARAEEAERLVQQQREREREHQRQLDEERKRREEIEQRERDRVAKEQRELQEREQRARDQRHREDTLNSTLR